MWEEKGPYALLHHLNYLRIPFIQEWSVLRGASLLDIGCGGGILSLPLARLGAHVTGIDQDAAAIEEARRSDPHITYLCQDLLRTRTDVPFDIIIASEVLEHMENLTACFEHLYTLLQKDGILIISTINKTWQSYVGAIACAEYIMRWVPKGTHQWDHFIQPSQLDDFLTKAGFQLLDLRGMTYNPFNKQWKWSRSVAINYIIAARKI